MPTTTRVKNRSRWTRILRCGLLPALHDYLPWDVFERWSQGHHDILRRFPRQVVLWGMLWQASRPDASDAAACQQLAAWTGCANAPHSGAYGKAKQRFPTALLAEMVRASAAALPPGKRLRRRFGNRRVLVVDGLCSSLADSPANQQQYPQPSSQQPGCGFPTLRLVVVMDAATGAVVDWAWGSLQDSETALLQQLWTHFRPGDLLVLDRGFASYSFLAAAQAAGVDVVVRQHQRQLDQRPRQALDWTETRPQPTRRGVWWRADEPRWLRVRVIYHRLPSGRWLKLNTTLSRHYRAADLAQLYRERWRIETQFLALKQGLGLGQLAARRPDTAERAVLAHLLLLNLLTRLRREAAVQRHCEVWRVSLKSLVGALEAARMLSPRAPRRNRRWVLGMLWLQPLQDRPDEPRARKRRPRQYRLLNLPRAAARATLGRGRA